jgi:TRAP-type C4-dicarboxylate transport system substrate-binding protein
MKTINLNGLVPKALFILLLFSLMACGKEKDVTIIKLGHGLSVSHSVHKAMEYMAERLKEKSDSTVLIEIYPNQQLGNRAGVFRINANRQLGEDKSFYGCT